VTYDGWLASHPYLRQVSDLHTLVDTTAAESSSFRAAIPDWNAYLEDYHAGVPLLRSSGAAIDLRGAQMDLACLAASLTSKPLPGTLAWEARTLNAELNGDPESPRRAVAWLLDRDSCPCSHPGLLQYLGWSVLERFLRPLVTAFTQWRTEERWLLSYCPTCGGLPAMAQLKGTDPGRLRMLFCGCCHTRWRYRRTGCPFCEKQDDHRLAAVAVEGEGGLRIDYCEDCRGYLKTYNGEGSEAVLMLDWTSLHLDVIARDRGLKRMAASLYSV
jgi:FdhE protein